MKALWLKTEGNTTEEIDICSTDKLNYTSVDEIITNMKKKVFGAHKWNLITVYHKDYKINHIFYEIWFIEDFLTRKELIANPLAWIHLRHLNQLKNINMVFGEFVIAKYQKTISDEDDIILDLTSLEDIQCAERHTWTNNNLKYASGLDIFKEVYKNDNVQIFHI